MHQAIHHARLLLTCFFITLAYAASGQANWVTGYVVTQQGDTLRGQIDDRDWLRSPDQVRFRFVSNRQEQTFSAGNALSFFIEPARERYVRFSGSLNKLPKNTNELPKKPAPQWVTDTVFLNVLVDGPLSLALHRGQQNDVHYLIKSDSSATWQELLSLRYLGENNDIREVERYKQQLYLAMMDCPSVSSRSATAILQEVALVRLVSAYNMCKGAAQKKEYVSRNLNTAFNWGVLAGVNITNAEFTGGDVGGNTFTYRAPVSPTAGLWATYTFGRSRGQWAAYFDARYQGYNASHTASTPPSYRGYINYRYLKVNVAMRWQYPGKSQTKPYALLGISNGFVLSKARNIAFNGDRNHEEGLFGGIGIRHKQVLFDIRYEIGNGTSDLDEVRMLTNTITAQLAFQF